MPQAGRQASREPPFHAFTIRYNHRADRIITDIGVSAAYDVTTPPQGPRILQTKALWDTGATRSVVTKKTVSDLGLAPTGMTRVNHAGGTSHQQTHVVNFFLPNSVVLSGVPVTECEDTVGEFGAIIGMDIISGGDIALTNHEGKTAMTFRFPAFEGIDFVPLGNRFVFSGTGRNDPCPCGATGQDGRPIKFKKCHGR